METKNKTDSQNADNTDASSKPKRRTIYDDIFRSIVENIPFLVIPLVNEVFGTDYKADEPITQLRNEHTRIPDSETSGKIITDSRVQIRETRYHFECQSTLDPSMVKRMYEYDTAYALEYMVYTPDGQAKLLQYPSSCVLYVRSFPELSDCLKLPCKDMYGQLHMYQIPVMCAQDYSIEQIFDKNLMILLPYYIMRYETALKKENPDATIMEQILNDYRLIAAKLDAYYESTEQNLWLLDITGTILALTNYLIPATNDTKRKVVEIMSGTNFMLLSKECEARGRAEGRTEGRTEGITEGRLQQAEETVLNLYKLNMPIEIIAHANNVSVAQAYGWLEKAGLLKCSAI